MPFWINIIAMIIGLVISGLVGLILIPYLKKLHFGQTILEIGPAWHKSKEGTPTMGGFMFLAGTLVATAAGYGIYYTVTKSTVTVPDLSGLYKASRGSGIFSALLSDRLYRRLY